MYEIRLVRKRLFWYLKLVSVKNGATLMHSETYFTKSNARRAGVKLARTLHLRYIER